MPKSTVAEDNPYPLPEGELLPLQLIDCRETNVQYSKKDGTPGSFKKWEWTFTVESGEYEGIDLKAGTEPKVTNATEAAFLPLARPIVEALYGRNLELGEEVDTDLLIGLRAQGTAKHLEPRPRKNGDGHWFNCELDEIFPAYGPNVTGQPAAAPAASGWNGMPDQPPY